MIFRGAPGLKAGLALLVLGALASARPGLSAAELADTLERIKPAIVGVGTYLPTRRPPSRLLGTGFVVGDGRLVATNAHVVNAELALNGQERLVVFSGVGPQSRILAAELVARDTEHDLALLRIGKALPSLTLAAPGRVREGQVYAFTGFPIGAVLGLYPVTHRGMISSITPMAIPASSAGQLDVRKIRRLRDPITVYQLDATAYPGNSGSPLFDPRDGAVVGILNQVYVKATKEDVLSTPSGISYAIPAEHLEALLEQQEGR